MTFNRFYLFITILCFSCNNPETKESSSNKKIISSKKDVDGSNEHIDIENEKNALSFLQSKGLLNINDTCKWILYNLYSTYELPKALQDTGEKIFLSYLDLRPSIYHLAQDKKSIDIIYLFFYKGFTVQNYPTSDGIIVKGVNVGIKDRKINYFLNGHGSQVFINDIPPPDIAFIQQNREKINRWYKDALIQHGYKFDNVGNTSK